MMVRAGNNTHSHCLVAKMWKKILEIQYCTLHVMILQVPGKNSRTVGTELTFECKIMKIKGLRITLSQSL